MSILENLTLSVPILVKKLLCPSSGKKAAPKNRFYNFHFEPQTGFIIRSSLLAFNQCGPLTVKVLSMDMGTICSLVRKSSMIFKQG